MVRGMNETYGHPRLALYVLWALWTVSWLVASRWASPAIRRPQGLAERTALLLTAVGFVALLAEPPGLIRYRIWQPGPIVQWSMVAVTVGGFAFCWWARAHLGRLWSVSTTVKPDQRLVESGPYALARHPIYSGILLAALARMIQQATPMAVAGFVVLLGGLWVKTQVEEGFLAAELGQDAYGAYAAKVRRLIPFVL
jgi:protein-S-isoprenylcysteine O-methyltransferase Ste14